jgi:hypothetical protein
MKYLLIAYKSDSSDYSMGCHVESYPSDFDIRETEDYYKLVDLCAGFLSKPLGAGETGYELNVLGDGEWILHESYPVWDDDFGKELNELGVKLQTDMRAREKELTMEREELDKKKKEQEKKEERERQRREAIRQRDKLLKEYPLTSGN